MKKSILLLIIFFVQYVNAQVPQGIPYQAVARNGQGQPLASTIVKVRFCILDSTATGTAVYVESHTTTTSTLGLFTANVGMGTASTGTFSSINWGQNFKFLKVELDTTATGNSYIDLGTQQMMSVPYALYAGSVFENNINGSIGDYPGQPSGKRYIEYNYTGLIDSFIVPLGVYSLGLECYGAGLSGKGGYISGRFYCTPGQKLYVVVGGTNGYNGGGDTISPTNRSMFNFYNATNGIPFSKGSGASDIRLNKTDLFSRIITAGGAGAAWNGNPNTMYGTSAYATGGAGGSVIISTFAAAGGNGQSIYCGGNPGLTPTCATSGGGSVTLGGAKACVPLDAWAGVDCNQITDGGFGFGGNGQVGGGGGYFGGGGATMGAYFGGQTSLAAGGGSSYANPQYISLPVQIIGGINHGNGKIIISW